MATQEQLEAALRNAAARARAGDERAAMAARRFAAELKAMRGSEQPAQPKTVEELTPGLSTNPTDGMSGAKRFAAGAGKSVADTARGMAQLGYATMGGNPALGLANIATNDSLNRLLGRQDAGQAVNAAVEQARQDDAALMDTGAGMAGNIAGQVSQMVALPGMAPGRLANAAMQGATFAGAQPVGEGESRLQNMVAGAALGAAGDRIAAGAGLLAKRAMESLNPVVRQSIELARAAGIPLNVAQTTNSAPVRVAQAVTKYLPFSGAGSKAQAQQEAFNEAVGRSFGADAKVLSDDVMQAARKRLSDTFNDIYSRNDVGITPDVVRRLAELEREAVENAGSEAGQIVRAQVDRILKEAGDGSIPGSVYQALRTKLQSAEKQGGNIGRLIKGVREQLDDAAVRSVSPEDAAALSRVRSQWANLRTTEDALKQVAGASGNVRPAALYPLIRKGATREMRELAKIGQNVLKEGVGDSGTAQREFYQRLVTGLGGSGLAVGAGGAAALPMLAKGMAGGAVLGRLLNSNVASKALQQGRPTSALAKLVQPAPKVLPVGYAAAAPAFDIGLVTDRMPVDENDPLLYAR